MVGKIAKRLPIKDSTMHTLHLVKIVQIGAFTVHTVGLITFGLWTRSSATAEEPHDALC